MTACSTDLASTLVGCDRCGKVSTAAAMANRGSVVDCGLRRLVVEVWWIVGQRDDAWPVGTVASEVPWRHSLEMVDDAAERCRLDGREDDGRGDKW
jgi:hypothetical protein